MAARNVSVNGGETWTAPALPHRAALSRRYNARLFPITSAARSRTTPPSACPAIRRESRRPRWHSRAAGCTRGRRRERLHRARSAAIRIFSTPAARARCSPRFDRRTGTARDIQVYPLFFSGECRRRAERALAVDVPHRVLAHGSQASSTRPRSTSGRPPTTARTGNASART